MERRLPAFYTSGTCSGVREQITGEPTAQKARRAVVAHCLHTLTRRPDDACNAECVISFSIVARAVERPNCLPRWGKRLTLPNPGRRAHRNVTTRSTMVYPSSCSLPLRRMRQGDSVHPLPLPVSSTGQRRQAQWQFPQSASSYYSNMVALYTMPSDRRAIETAVKSRMAADFSRG